MFPNGFKLDKDNLWYIEDNDINKSPIYFPKVGLFYNEHVKRFYKVDGIDNLIIKDTSHYPLFFNQTRNKKLLKELLLREDDIPSVDVPQAYFKKNNRIMGMFVPYYPNSVSYTRLINFHSKQDVLNYYNHDSDTDYNLLLLCLETLNILKELYDAGIAYLDINDGNFLIYNNQVKVIDFEPGFVKITKNKEIYLYRIVDKYLQLVKLILYRLNFSESISVYGSNFQDIEESVKRLEKVIKR